jgi:hypothetical protein
MACISPAFAVDVSVLNGANSELHEEQMMPENTSCPNLIAALTKKITPGRQAVIDFYALCPSFCDTPSNWDIIANYLPTEFDFNLRWPTTEELNAAYQLAKGAGHFRVN